ncbi:hypothetical protein [Mucilaginibacter gynuensis]
MLFAFSVMEKPITSVAMMLAAHDTCVTDCPADDEESEAANRNEAKESPAKEFLPVYSYTGQTLVLIDCELLKYAGEENHNHLAYFPAVPTPPPDVVFS